MPAALAFGGKGRRITSSSLGCGAGGGEGVSSLKEGYEDSHAHVYHPAVCTLLSPSIVQSQARNKGTPGPAVLRKTQLLLEL